MRGRDYEYGGDTSGLMLSNFKNELRGCGPFLHNDPRDRPPEIFENDVTLHFGPDRPQPRPGPGHPTRLSRTSRSGVAVAVCSFARAQGVASRPPAPLPLLSGVRAGTAGAESVSRLRNRSGLRPRRPPPSAGGVPESAQPLACEPPSMGTTVPVM